VADYSEYFKKHWASLQQADVYRPTPNPTWGNPRAAEASYKVLIVRLSPFRDVNRSTPHLFLFQAVRSVLPEAFIDMAFFPPQHDRKRFREESIPFVTGVRSHLSIDDFDLVLISNAYTLELINLYVLLLESGVPLRASLRGEELPALILGGSNAMAAQAVVTQDADSLVDAIFFGEGEEQVPRLVQVLYDNRTDPKATRLAHAGQQIEGLWVTGAWPTNSVRKATVVDPGSAMILEAYPVLNGSQAGVSRVQIDVGCPSFCSFCFESYDRRPYREVSSGKILEEAKGLKQEQGSDVLELYSFNFNSHSQIFDLLLQLNLVFNRVSMKSQRADLLDQIPGLLDAEIASDKRSFTLGIEGISEQMRAFLHKSLATDTIFHILDRLLKNRARQIKLFFILTGHETATDLSEFREFTRRLRALRQKTGPGIRITFSIGFLVRMPRTPLQYSALTLDRAVWRAIVGPVKSACETNGFDFRLATKWDEYCASQVMALGSYWLFEPLEHLARQGHCYDKRLTPGFWPELKQWMESHNHWNPMFLGEKPEKYPFPFDFVQSNVTSHFLYRQYQDATRHVDSGYCLGSLSCEGVCLGCGACPTEERRLAILHHAPQLPASPDYLARLRELVVLKRHLRPIYVVFRIPDAVHGAGAAWLNAFVLRNLISSSPALLDNLLSAAESLFTVGDTRRAFPTMTGQTVFALTAWHPESMLDELVSREHVFEEGLKLERVEEEFQPGVFREAEILLTLPSEVFQNVRASIVDFLRDAYVPVNIRRAGSSGRFSLDLPAKALKRRVVFAGELWEAAESTHVKLAVTPKFRLLDFLKGACADSSLYRLAHAEVTNLDV